MEESLFDVLSREGLTTLKINYDWKTDKAVLKSAKEWDDKVKWRNYNKEFFLSSALTSDAVYLNDSETRKLFEKYSLTNYLERIIDLMRKGKHILIECFYLKEKNIRFINNVHSDVLGINNRRHAIRAGGIRRHNLNENEYDVILDGLNLARAMTYKNYAANVLYGGCKLTVQQNPPNLDDMDEMGFLAYAIDRSRDIAGPDMGYPPEITDVLNKHYTLNIAAGRRGPLGPSGIPTAYGVYLAVKQAAKFVWGSDSLKGKKIAVQGLGQVGFYLAEHYIREGAHLIVTDINQDPVLKLKSKYTKAKIDFVEPGKIYSVDADIFSPCAVGGIITRDRISNMKFKIIMGAANNQLEASSIEEEIEMAKLLDKFGILFQIAWWHNVGGVISGMEEYENQEKASKDNVFAKITEICTKRTWENLNEAKKLGITPTERAYKVVDQLIYGS